MIEAVSLASPDPRVWWVPLFLLTALGLAVAAAVTLQEWIIRRLALAPLRAAPVRAAGALIPLVPLGGTLFDGARATSLPGASLAPIWVPAAGFVFVAAAAYAHARLARLRLTAALLLALALAVEAANRTLYRSGYPHVHLFLSVVSVTATVLALRGLVRRVPFARVLPAAAIFGLGLALAFGLARPSQRWVVATHGVHTRHLVRVVRSALDLDHDGYSAALGGPDCDDADARVHPLAADLPGNAVDEDCDGEPAVAPPPAPFDPGAALAAWLAAPDTRAALAAHQGDDVLLVTIDALRADLLADTPENRADFPNLFAVLDQSLVFRHAFSTGAGTDVAVPAIMTGRIDPFTTVDTTLAEALQGAGRRTHAVLPTEVLRWVGQWLITRGFDAVDRVVNDAEGRQDEGTYTTSAMTTERALAFLADPAAQRPWFLWLHYFDLHEHHQIDRQDHALSELAGDGPLGPRRKYRLLLELVDQQLGRVLAELRERGRWDDTIVIVTSDHGEAFGEDPRLPDHHGEMVYNPLVHVPLAIRLPGGATGSVDEVCSLIDLAPTVALLAGVPRLGDADGTPLLPFLIPGAPTALRAARPAVLHETAQVGVIAWPYKLMRRPEENLTELYDLSTDFAERRDLSAEQPERVRELTRLYQSYPAPRIDRSRQGRRSREEQGRRPQPR